MRTVTRILLIVSSLLILTSCGESSNQTRSSVPTPQEVAVKDVAPTAAISGPVETSSREFSLAKQYDEVTSCASFDTWSWAQSVFDTAPDKYGALDPDGNGIACEQLTIYGFGPAVWADKVPADTDTATLVSVTDGDTIRVRFPNGLEDTVRLLHIDTPETNGTVGQCGGNESTEYLRWILSYAGSNTIYLESDVTKRDQYDRRLAYVWFEVDGDSNPYMANHAMVMAGWAESETYKPDVKYKTELDTAEKFSVDHVTGVRLLCGKFGQPANDAGPSEEQVRQAWLKQPNQGQLPAFPGTVAGESMPSVNPVTTGQGSTDTTAVQPPAESNVNAIVNQPVVQEPVAEQPIVQDPVVEEPPPEPVNECDPSYPDFCLAPAWVIGDLDCGDVGQKRFRVFPPDSHGFDRDGDGVGCES